MKRFGKPSAEYLTLSGGIFAPEGNDRMLASKQRILDVYARQPRREGCKLCTAPLPADAVSRPTEYLMCPVCGHANGPYLDTPAYHQAYWGTGEGEQDAARYYASETRESYLERVTGIYRPKADFLAETIRAGGGDPTRLRCLEVGAGSGYMAAALRDAGFAQVEGWEVSSLQVEFGNRMLGETLLHRLDFSATTDLIRSAKAEVLTMIFVLEHVEQHDAVMRAIADNPHLRYFFFAVPTLSVSTFIEGAFPTIYARNSSGHCHLYTDSSIAWMERSYGFRRAGEWWFGADAVDLMRSVALRLHQLDGHDRASAQWCERFRPMIDALQVEIDRHRLSSEAHIVFAREG